MKSIRKPICLLALFAISEVVSQQNSTYDPCFPNFVCERVPILCGSRKCRTVAPLSAEQFSLENYIEKTWYVQKQQPNPYQSEDDLFCVTATYNLKENGQLEVLNYGNSGGVNEGVMGTSPDGCAFSNLCAEQESGGRLKVAPCLLGLGPTLIGGPYWVLAVAPDYSWAIISGGQPDQVRQEEPEVLCTTKEGLPVIDINGSGLWLFTRERFPSNSVIETMEEKLVELGVWPGDLIDVVHEDCRYEGSNHKA